VEIAVREYHDGNGIIMVGMSEAMNGINGSWVACSVVEGFEGKPILGDARSVDEFRINGGPGRDVSSKDVIGIRRPITFDGDVRSQVSFKIIIRGEEDCGFTSFADRPLRSPSNRFGRDAVQPSKELIEDDERCGVG
jgi:hypothetical protein